MKLIPSKHNLKVELVFLEKESWLLSLIPRMSSADALDWLCMSGIIFNLNKHRKYSAFLPFIRKIEMLGHVDWHQQKTLHISGKLHQRLV